MVISKPIQIRNLKRRCKKLNPDKDCDSLDYEAFVSSTDTYWTNLDNMKDAYPDFEWKTEEEREIPEEKILGEELEYLEDRAREIREKLNLPLEEDELQECYDKLDKVKKMLPKIYEEIKKLKEAPPERVSGRFAPMAIPTVPRVGGLPLNPLQRLIFLKDKCKKKMPGACETLHNEIREQVIKVSRGNPFAERVLKESSVMNPELEERIKVMKERMAVAV